MRDFFKTNGDFGKIASFLTTKVILTWQFLVLIALVFLLPTLKKDLGKLNRFKGEGFELYLEQAAFIQGVDDTTIRKLKALDYDALQLFLAKGGIHGDQIKPAFDYLPNGRLEQMNILLDSLHLLRYGGKTWRNDINSWWFTAYTTDEGRNLHSAIMSAIGKTFAKDE